MTREEIDSTTFSGTITTTTNEVLEVETVRAEDVLIMIDDGTTGNQPPTYDMSERIYTDEQSGYQFYDKVTGETSRSWVEMAWGTKMEFEFNNQSGADANYRITIKVYRSV